MSEYFLLCPPTHLMVCRWWLSGDLICSCIILDPSIPSPHPAAHSTLNLLCQPPSSSVSLDSYSPFSLLWIFRHCSLCSAVWLVRHHFLTNYSLPEITSASCLTSSKALLYNRFLNNLFTSVDNPPFKEPAPVSQICKM